MGKKSLPDDVSVADQAYRRLLDRIVTEVYNRENLAAVEELFPPTLRFNNETISRGELVESIDLIHDLLPDFTVDATVEATTDDLILARWTYQRSIDDAREGQGWTRLQMFRVVDDQVVDIWIHWAGFEYLQNVGLDALAHRCWPSSSVGQDRSTLRGV
jgi:hypothetical protein